MSLRDRLLHYAETVAFGIVWLYLLPVAFIGWCIYGDDQEGSDEL